MTSTDDPFLRFLAASSGDVIRFCPGRGGVDHAVSSLSFLALCERFDLTVDDGRPDALCFFGSDAAAAAAPDRRLVLLPSGLTQFEAVSALARRNVSLFCRDPRSMRVAELQGVPHDRRWLCQDLACYLDLAAFDLPRGEGEGTLRLDVGDGEPGGQERDGIAFRLSGADGRWRSPERCRHAIQQLISALAPYAVVRTTSPTLAILVTRIGRKAILCIDEADGYAATWRSRMAAAHPGLTFEAALAVEPALVLSTRPAIQLKRDLRRAAQERDTMAAQLAALREEFDARVAAEVIAIERDAQGTRLLPARMVEERLKEAEQHLAEAEARAATAVETLEAERDMAQSAAERLAELQRREQALIDEVARLEQLARERESFDGLASAETQELMSLQNTIAEMTRALQLAETQMAHTLMLLEQSKSAEAKAERTAWATRDRLDAVLSSASWKLTGPLRAGGRVLRLLAGSGRRRRGS